MNVRSMLLSAVLVIGLAACHQPPDGAAGPAEPPDPKLGPAQLSFLKFGPVVEAGVPDLADLPATIEFDEHHTARLSALLRGRVAELLVEVGDQVAADQPLLAIDGPEVKSAQAEYVRAEADLVLARKAADRAERLRAARAIAEKDHLQASEDLQKAGADFEHARAQLERLRVTPGDRTTRYLLRAPFGGTVVERKALVGMEVSTDAPEPLAVVSDLSRVRVVVRVPARQVELVRLGQPVMVRVDASPREFPGEVAAIGDVVEDATQTVPVRCIVPNPDRRLKPAMFARVSVKPPADLRLVMVPVGAVLSDGENSQVVVRRLDGQLELRAVQVGAEVGEQVQVLSGVTLGEEVVTEGAIFAARALASS